MSPLDIEGNPERVLGPALAHERRPLRAGGAVDADGRHIPQRGRDVGRIEATGEDDRDLAGDRPGKLDGDPLAAPARMRAARGVEKDSLGAGREEGARPVDHGGCLVAISGNPNGLPGRSARSGDVGGALVAAELDAVGIEGGDDLGDPLRPGVGGDRDDPRRRRRQGAGDPGEGHGLREAQFAGRSRDEVQADRISPAAHSRQHALGVGDPADLDDRRGHAVGRVGRDAAGANERAHRRRRIGGADERLADQGRVEAGRTPGGDRGRVAHAGFGHDEPIVGHQRSEADREARVDGQGPEVPVVDPDQAGVRGDGPGDLGFIVSLDERLEPDLEGPVDELCEAGGFMEHGQEQDEVRAGRPQVGQLDVLDDEVLGEDRDRDGGSHPAQVVDGAAEPVRLAQDGDRAGTAGLVGPGPGDDVLVRRGDGAGRRRGPLDLGDQVEARSRQALDDRAGRGRRRRDGLVLFGGPGGHLHPDVRSPTVGDVMDDAALAAARTRRG